MREIGLEKMIQWVDNWEDATQDARVYSERDRDYYDGKQWTAEEESELNRRKQPIVTINRIAKKVNYLLGTEVRTRTDPSAAPRTPQHEDGATAATDALRYVADKEDLPQTFSEAFESMAIEGYGGAVVEVEQTATPVPIAGETTITPTDDGAEVSDVAIAKVESKVDVKVRPVPWDRLIYDHHSRRWDFEDARYLGVVVWLDRADAEATYPDSEEALEAAVSNSTSTDETTDDRPRVWTDGKRDRVKVVEMYYQQAGEWYFCHFTKGGYLVEPRKVPFVNEEGESVCPLVMVSCFVDRDNNRYGLVRNMVSPQDEVNKRRSKALHLLNMRQTIGEEGAVNVTETKTELAKPDGHITRQPGMDFQLLPTGEMAQGQLTLMQEAKGEIDTIGPDAGVVAGSSAGQSGRAVLARQQMASLELEKVFDRFRHFKTEVYRQVWYRVRQFWTDEKWLRIRDDDERKGFRFVGINQQMTKGQRLMQLLQMGVPFESAVSQLQIQEAPMVMQQVQMQAQAVQQQTGQPIPPEAIQQQVMAMMMQTPSAQEPFTNNDITKLEVDILLTEAPDTAVVQQEEFEELVQMAGQGLPISPEIIIEASHLRNKKKLLEMMRQPNPQAQEAAQMQAQMGQAQLQKTASEAQRNQAQAAKYAAEAQTTPIKVSSEAQRDQASAMKQAAEAGEKAGSLDAAMTPGI